MNQEAAGWEREICDSYRAQCVHYAQALEVARALSPEPPATDGVEDALQQLGKHLNEVAKLDAQVREPLTRWQALGRSPGAALQAAMDAVRTHLEELIPLINLAEQAAQAAKQRLRPRLDAQSRSIRMQAAYRSTGDGE